MAEMGALILAGTVQHDKLINGLLEQQKREVRL